MEERDFAKYAFLIVAVVAVIGLVTSDAGVTGDFIKFKKSVSRQAVANAPVLMYLSKQSCESITNKVCEPASGWKPTSRAVAPPAPADPNTRESCIDTYSSEAECRNATRGSCAVDIGVSGGPGEELWKHDPDNDAAVGCFESSCRPFWGSLRCPRPDRESGGSCTSAYLDERECHQMNQRHVCVKVRNPSEGWKADIDRDGTAGSDDTDCRQWVR